MERYVRSSMENEPGLEWNGRMLKWIQGAIHYWNTVQKGGAWDGEIVSGFLEEHDRIMEKARDEYEYEPPSDYFKDGYNTYIRMEKDKEDYVLFLRDPSVPPSNNVAE